MLGSERAAGFIVRCPGGVSQRTLIRFWDNLAFVITVGIQEIQQLVGAVKRWPDASLVIKGIPSAVEQMLRCEKPCLLV